MKTCPACNHQNPVDTSICKSCGYRLEISAGWEKTKIRDTDIEGFAVGYLVADRYKVIREIGRGGMGMVYLVQDEWLESREVALKMIHPQLVELPEARQRFRQEVSTCLDLLHPNIVRVHNLEEWHGLQFFTMEYITGRSLQELIAERKSKKPPFTLFETAAIITLVLDALAYAHQYTIHRDIKPDNIIVMGDFPDVSVKVLDFGIAKTLTTSGFTQTAQVLGTAFYMAPEQMSGAQIDHRADLYSAGMIFYEMLTGEMAVGAFRMPGEIVAELPQTLDVMIRKALAPRPEQRFADAEAMSREIQRILAGPVPEIKTAPVISEPESEMVEEKRHKTAQDKIRTTKSIPAVKRQSLKPWAYASVVILVLLLATGVFFWSRFWKPADTTTKKTSKKQVRPESIAQTGPVQKKQKTVVQETPVVQKPSPLSKSTAEETASFWGFRWKDKLPVSEAEIKTRQTKTLLSQIDSLIRDLGNKRSSAVEVLAKIGAPAVEPLTKALDSETLYVAVNAVDALGRMKDPKSIDALIIASEHWDRQVRLGAIKALTNKNDPRVSEVLIARLKDDYDKVRSQSAKGLGIKKDSRAIEPLMAIMDDKKSAVQSAAMNSLGEFDDKRVSEAIKKKLNDYKLRHSAASLLLERGWIPKSEKDKVHFWAALKRGDELRKNWPIAKKVLQEDILIGNYSEIKAALDTFIGIGHKEIIPKLVRTLNTAGNKDMAKVYLNSGDPELERSAREWSRKHGYMVFSIGKGSKPPIEWGNM